ncbi:YicC domain protein [Hyphomicrobium denitrificans ATCC 51888]|uniref:YicC domain protein n=1 Tax=Hyphomicrobium denitrificans (strain ATCC 51888 / DSM 1869 / NCIMB 11706 / TK 0415) TaxID=582899 RepID=D8JYR2_HYPDA|nr:YicC/YloC family endoribonuclease [Hyphomicrobium denitrificans]ADJ23514.1 YicC domain protein [Hyphomicrobium denitrificans ATCC 51888]
MTISSMTGFARADGSTDGLSWIWEARSVNGRGLDVRLRLPPGYEALEIPAREAVAKRFARGSISLSLSIEKQQTNGAIRLNEQVLADVIKAADRVSTLSGATKPDAAQLLMIKGVLETSDQATEDAAARATREKTILQSLEAALDKLGEARRAEGARLGGVIHDQISQIEQLAATVRASPSRAPEAVMTRLKDAIARLVDTTAALDDQRLHQEAVLIATRADVEEELQRLSAHVAAARDILAERGSVGRKLDFLAQEFNREANTLCSKANAVDITRLGLQLKTVIDQFREQVQNVE